ncbi:transcriptional regulator Erg [Trichonephila inaurata madagascariensis]|uniref:Transcriptional regulator Erg n=1 Tax=Trichonephila inaurata madagascariensis TaxID=2747483 RepID=A0A8X7BZJ9_9ARAC|nr:transcriptional regulator Erg [Trichonephila inaurata madagascariensis]
MSVLLSPNTESLFLPPDPVLWNPEHVKQWLEWAVKEYNLHEVDAARFNVIGRELCQLTRDDFSRLTNPYNGEVLYAHLNFLRQTSEASLPPASREKPPVSAQTGPSQVPSGKLIRFYFLRFAVCFDEDVDLQIPQ